VNASQWIRKFATGSQLFAAFDIPSSFILELLSSGMSIEEVLADYEDLEREDILATLDFARQLSQIKRMSRLLHEVSY